jgi:hypothetical protein
MLKERLAEGDRRAFDNNCAKIGTIIAPIRTIITPTYRRSLDDNCAKTCRESILPDELLPVIDLSAHQCAADLNARNFDFRGAKTLTHQPSSCSAPSDTPARVPKTVPLIRMNERRHGCFLRSHERDFIEFLSQKAERAINSPFLFIDFHYAVQTSTVVIQTFKLSVHPHTAPSKSINK